MGLDQVLMIIRQRTYAGPALVQKIKIYTIAILLVELTKPKALSEPGKKPY
jgi:hypothetical protein